MQDACVVTEFCAKALAGFAFLVLGLGLSRTRSVFQDRFCALMRVRNLQELGRFSVELAGFGDFLFGAHIINGHVPQSCRASGDTSLKDTGRHREINVGTTVEA